MPQGHYDSQGDLYHESDDGPKKSDCVSAGAILQFLVRQDGFHGSVVSEDVTDNGDIYDELEDAKEETSPDTHPDLYRQAVLSLDVVKGQFQVRRPEGLQAFNEKLA